MSDTSQGPGWWLASDGKWYPPQQQSQQQQPRPQVTSPPISTTSPGPGRWLASDGKWYPPQQSQPPVTRRPWWKKKRFILPSALLALFVIVGVASSDSEDKAEKTTTTTAPRLFPGRADAQKEDQERNTGESVQISGLSATLNSAAFQQRLSSFETDGYIVVNVTIENRDKKTQNHSLGGWKVQTPNGEVIDATFTSKGGTLGSSAVLVTGGKATGDVVFDVGATKGDFYVIYKPDPFNAARGIWKLTV